MKKRRLEKFHAGFNLIELMVVIAIITIMTGIAIININSSGKSQALLRSSQRDLASAIRLAQSYALTGKSQSSATLPVCGYGLRFIDESKYEVYYNVDSDCTTFNQDSINRKFDKDISNNAEAGEVHQLESNIVYNNPGTDSLSSVAYDQFSIYYSIPHGNAFGTSGEDLVQPVTVELKHENIENKEAYIAVVNAGGSVTEKTQSKP